MSLPTLKKALHYQRPETKVRDTLSTATCATTLTVVDYATDIPQGLTNLTRIGKQVVLQSYRIRLNLIPDPTATDPGEIRVVFWYQTYPNSSLMIPDNYLQTVNNIQSFRQIDQSGYRVLYDKVHQFSMTDFRNKYVQISLPVKGKHIEWTEADTAGAANNIRQGYIRGAIMYANFGGVAPSYDLWQRVTYTDS